MRRKSVFILSAAALLLPFGSALADVKAGVDAWGRGDFQKAVAEWRTPAIQGDADAQFNLGQAYKLGRGVKADLDIAMDWYQKAARQGHLQAADSIGHLLHYRGRIGEALPYLNASAQRGEPRAQYLLGTELFNGVHTQKDWVRAYALMTRASASGMSAASRSLAQMDQYIPLEQRQQGTVLAGKLEESARQARVQQTSGFPIDTRPQAPVSQPVEVPAPAPATTAGFPADIPARGQTPSPVRRPVEVAPVEAAPVAVAASGPWRIQLGAFSNEANARNLWNRLESKIGQLSALQPYLNSAGRITRLQAGPFANRTDAEVMCSRVKETGQACIAIRN